MWYGTQLYKVLRNNLTGTYMQDVLENLESLSPDHARGLEAWFRLVRNMKGATGPRMLALIISIFLPTRVKDAKLVPEMIESMEKDIRELGVMGLDIPGILKSFALLQLIPAEMARDLQKLRQDLRDYTSCRTWCLDQVASSRPAGKALAPSDLMNLGDDAKRDEEKELPAEAPSPEELLAVWKGRSKGKSKGKGKSSREVSGGSYLLR